MIVTNQRTIPIDIWRKLEDYTPTITTIVDNDATKVVVLNITGRGIWVCAGGAPAGRNVKIQYNIDGAGATEDEWTPALTGIGTWMFMIGFTTSLNVQMRLDAPGSAKFSAVALVE